MNLILTRASSPIHWLKIYRLYRLAFPREERKPFSSIREIHCNHRGDVWYCTANGHFVGFASTVRGSDLVLVDYLAVSPAARNGGIGSAILGALRGKYPAHHLFLEIESVWEDVPDRDIRLRRKAFYLRNGFTPMKLMIWLFDVKMEVLGIDCTLDYSQYHDFYYTRLSPWVAEHISEAVHPEA
ncbi:MAG: GNAT family N-acetyltransferase [Oscillospiraceae bacterium]|nr:GNAT family N-acetyltransferase [Oscillospiraceae bacterium]